MFIAIPEGYYGRIVGCSGLANTHGITVHNGTTDSDYRGIVCVVLFNLFNEEYVVETDNRIGQLIIERCYTPKFVEVNEFNEEKTIKGQRGDMKELHYKLLNILLLTCFNNGVFFIASATDTKAVNLTTAKGSNFGLFVGFWSIFMALNKNCTGSNMFCLN